VTIGVSPVANFLLPQVCLSDPYAEFLDSSYITDGTQAQMTYLWNFGDPGANPGNPNTATIKNGRHSYTATGVYTVTLTVTSAVGCTNTVSKQVTINGGTPVADFAIQNTGTICALDTIVIQNMSTVNFGNVTKVEIYWDNANSPATVETDNSPSPNKLYRHLYANNTQPSASYTIRMIAYSGGVCYNSVTKTITVNSNPIATISLNPSQVCQGSPITFTDSSNNPNISVNDWRWTFSDNQTATTKTVSHTFNQVGSLNAKLQNVSTIGCVSSVASRQFLVNPIPQVNAGNDLFILEGGQAQIQASVNGSSSYRYAWTPANWLTSATVLQPTVIPQADITYKLTVTGRGDCVGSDEVTVKLLKGLVIPNAFSPNGDGINDRWVIQHLESYPGSIVQLYDRSGRIVFNSPSGVSVSWDGNVNGQPLPIGTYYYVIDPKNGRPPIKGSVTILR
jgi:gliding motility-associated-like protein